MRPSSMREEDPCVKKMRRWMPGSGSRHEHRGTTMMPTKRRIVIQPLPRPEGVAHQVMSSAASDRSIEHGSTPSITVSIERQNFADLLPYDQGPCYFQQWVKAGLYEDHGQEPIPQQAARTTIPPQPCRGPIYGHSNRASPIIGQQPARVSWRRSPPSKALIGG